MKIRSKTAGLATAVFVSTAVGGGAAVAAGEDPAGVVLIVNGAATSSVDQSAAAAVAARLSGALLLTETAGLPLDSLRALEDLNPARIIVVGGESSVSSSALGQIKRVAADATVVRVGGAHRYETSALLGAWVRNTRGGVLR